MSDSPQDISKLIENVGDARAKAALQAINQRVDDMARAFVDRDRKLRLYFFSRDGLHFDIHVAQLSERLLDHRQAGDDGLRVQLEADNVVLLQAQMRDDFPEFCRRAALMAEARVKGYLRWLASADVQVFEQAWRSQQQARAGREKNHRTCPPDRTLRSGGLGDHLEISFYVLFGSDFMSRTADRGHYYALVNARRVRNKASHRDSGGMFDFSALPASDYLKGFYTERQVKSYGSVVEALRALFDRMDRAFSRAS